MGKKRRILLAALAVAILGGLVWLVMPSGPPDPVYEGKPVSWWLRHPTVIIISGRSPETRFPLMDSNAVPYLIGALETRDGPLRRAYMRAWPNLLHWFGLPAPVAAAAVRENAAFVLLQMDREAEPAIPALGRAFRRDESLGVQFMAVCALGKMAQNDKRAMEVLVEALNDQNPYVSQMAGKVLQQVNPEAAAKAGVK